jgi:ketosteroid isomerase-like protein
MKSLTILTGALLLGFAPMAQANDAKTSDTGVEAVIRQFADALHAGDMKKARTFLTKRVGIVDDTAPYYWGGTHAMESWLADRGKEMEADGVSEGDAQLGQLTREEITGNHAYVIVPATYTYRQKGMAMRQPAQLTYFLDKSAAGWKIAGWTWTGPAPSPVK